MCAGRGREGTTASRLLHVSALDMYDRFAGGRRRALRTLDRVRNRRHGGERRARLVRGADGEWPERWPPFRWTRRPSARQCLPAARPASGPGLALARRAASLPRRRPRLPGPPAAAFYVDALATDPRYRRHGVARAAGRGRARGAAPCAALRSARYDTEQRRRPRLYAAEGFDEVAYRPAARGLPGFVALVKPLD